MQEVNIYEQCFMAIGAHIGDVELTSGLVLANQALKGDKIITVALTAGERQSTAFNS